MNAVLLVALLHRREQTLRTGNAMPVRTVAFRVANEVWITVIETEFLQAHIGVFPLDHTGRISMGIPPSCA